MQFGTSLALYVDKTTNPESTKEREKWLSKKEKIEYLKEKLEITKHEIFTKTDKKVKLQGETYQTKKEIEKLNKKLGVLQKAIDELLKKVDPKLEAKIDEVKTKIFEMQSNDVRSIAVDDTSVWVGTASGGITHFSKDFITAQNYTMNHGLLDNQINSLMFFQNELYVATPAGLNRFAADHFDTALSRSKAIWGE